MITRRPCLADLITGFFSRHLATELNASGHTITSYRDTFRLLLVHVATLTGRPVSRLALDDLVPDAILHFLEFLEQQRGNSVRTRNARLAAIRSFFGYVVSQEPVAASVAQRVLHIPFKKTTGRFVGYLPKHDVEVLLAQPDRMTPKGRRDYLVLGCATIPVAAFKKCSISAQRISAWIGCPWCGSLARGGSSESCHYCRRWPRS